MGPETIFGTDCTNGSKTDLIQDLYQTSDEAYSKFCQNDCPCNLDQTSDLYQELSKYPQLNLTGDIKKVGDCKSMTSSSENIDVIATF